MKKYIILVGLIIFGLLLSGCVDSTGKELNSFQEIRSEVTNGAAVRCEYEDSNGAMEMFFSRQKIRMNMNSPLTGDMKVYMEFKDGAQTTYMWGGMLTALATLNPELNLPKGKEIGMKQVVEMSQEEFDKMWSEEGSEELPPYDDKFNCKTISISNISGLPSNVEFYTQEEMQGMYATE